MNRLKGLRCYLAGPIDQAPDDGVEWRQKITPWLEQKGVRVLDPCDKPIPDSYYKEIGLIHSPLPSDSLHLVVRKPIGMSIAQHVSAAEASMQRCSQQASNLQRPGDKIRTHHGLHIAIIAPHLELLLRRYLIWGDKKVGLGC